jgi:DNA-binding response OmpR family regulator
VVTRYLARDGHRIVEAADGDEARGLIEREAPSLVVLDVMLPGKTDGLALCRWIRSTSDLAVILLTARGEETDRIVGLELGADDYITKPFSPNEVIARIRALLRRAHRTGPADGRLTYGPLSVDVDRHVVRVHDTEIRLTAKEFLLLQYLMQHRGRVLSRDLLLSDVWGYSYTGGTRTVDVHVRRLREKVPFLTDAIETVKQFGYKLIEPAPPA